MNNAIFKYYRGNQLYINSSKTEIMYGGTEVSLDRKRCMKRIVYLVIEDPCCLGGSSKSTKTKFISMLE